MTEKNIIWESAGRAGLALGGVSTLYLLGTMLTARVAEAGGAAGILMTLVNAALWLAKFGGCIFLMRHFMLRFSHADPSADNARVFRFGALTALLSALIYAAAYLAYTTFLAPDIFEQVVGILQENPMMDANSMAMMEEMLPKMPAIGFFANLIYCWLFGTILAAIFSRGIPPRNPFIDEQ